MIVKHVTEVFGENWATVDLMNLENRETRRLCVADANSLQVFTRAVNALTRSLCRIDSGYLRHWWDGQYQEIEAGMFTLADLYAESRAVAQGKYVYDYSARSAELMDAFFEDVPEPEREAAAPQPTLDDIHCILQRIQQLSTAQRQMHAMSRAFRLDYARQIGELCATGLQLLQIGVDG